MILDLTGLIDMNEGNCHRILKIKVKKINVSQIAQIQMAVRAPHLQISQNPSFVTGGHVFTSEYK